LFFTNCSRFETQAVRNFNECLKLLRQSPINAELPVDVNAETLMFGTSDYMWMIVGLIHDFVGHSRHVDKKIRELAGKRSFSAPPRIAAKEVVTTSLEAKKLRLEEKLRAHSRPTAAVQEQHTHDQARHPTVVTAESRDKQLRGHVQPRVSEQVVTDLRTHAKRQEELLTKQQRQRLQNLDKDRMAVPSRHADTATRQLHTESSEYMRSSSNQATVGRSPSNDRMAKLQQEKFRSRVEARKFRITKHLVEQSVEEENKQALRCGNNNATVTAIAQHLVNARLNSRVGVGCRSEANQRQQWDSTTAIVRPRESSNSAGRSSEPSKANDESTDSEHKDDAKPRKMTPPRRPPSKVAEAGYWVAPAVDPLYARGLLSSAPLQSITLTQQNAVREWLQSLGLNVRDGEGGFFYHGHSPHTTAIVKLNPNVYANDTVNNRDPVTAFTTHGSNNGPFYGQYNVGAGDNNRFVPSDRPLPPTAIAEPLPLSQDKLRNGELLCDLVCILEPTVASHSNLSQLTKRQPRTLRQATDNIDRAIWLLRIKRSPPIPPQYLCQTDAILKGVKDVLWGLLWEIMQAYPSSIDIPTFDATFKNPFNSSSQSGPGNNNPNVSPVLNYSRAQRRQLDIVIIRWLGSIGVLSLFSGGLSMPSTIHSLEGPIRDGTLLCIVLENGFHRAVRSINKSPHSYSQCLSNVTKCIEELLAVPNMHQQYLKPIQVVSEGIVRGDWNVILSIFETIYRCYCSHMNITPSFIADVPSDDANHPSPWVPTSISPSHTPNLGFPAYKDPAWQDSNHSQPHSNLVAPAPPASRYQPRLPLDNGLNGGVSASSVDPAFMQIPKPPKSFDTDQEQVVYPPAPPKVHFDSAATGSKAVPINDNGNRLPPSSATAQISAGSNERDLYPGKYSTSIATAFNAQYEALSAGSGKEKAATNSGNGGTLSYSAHDLTRNDPALEHILGQSYTRSLSLNHSDNNVSSSASRDPSPSTSVLRQIDGVLADRHKWNRSTTPKSEKKEAVRDIAPGIFSSRIRSFPINAVLYVRCDKIEWRTDL
jgi:hypothetical protein